MQPPRSSDPSTRRALVAIGNFDGVHRGHQYLLGHVVQAAASADLVPRVLTFHPHPARVLGRSLLAPLTCLERKVRLLEALKVEVAVETFDAQLAQKSPREFVQQVLLDRHHVAQVVVGENFRFGKRRAGDLATLVSLGQEMGFDARAMALLSEGAEVISSSRIRKLVSVGDVNTAAELLGRPHTLGGRVIPGDKRGRQLGFPTANLDSVQELLPANGVYACRVTLAGGEESGLPAICNIGVRPTVGGTQVAVEVHLLDFNGDLYGQELSVGLVARLREERRFDDLAALERQITVDVADAARILAR